MSGLKLSKVKELNRLDPEHVKALFRGDKIHFQTGETSVACGTHGDVYFSKNPDLTTCGACKRILNSKKYKETPPWETLKKS